MDILEAEEKLAAWVSTIVEMPEKVYRGPLPPGLSEGFEVNLISGLPAGLNRVNDFTAEIRGIAPDRRTLWERFSRIFASLPLQNQAGFLYVDTSDEVTFSTLQKEGLQLSCGAIRLKASFV